MSDLALKLAARPDGVHSSDLGRRGYHILVALVQEGKLFRGKLGHRTTRYFTTKETADSYVEKNATAFLKAQERAGNRKGWGRDDPCVITPATKYTFAPPPKPPTHTNTHEL